MDDAGLKIVVGMTAAYAASFAGLFFAWYHARKRQREAALHPPPPPPRPELPEHDSSREGPP